VGSGEYLRQFLIFFGQPAVQSFNGVVDDRINGTISLRASSRPRCGQIQKSLINAVMLLTLNYARRMNSAAAARTGTCGRSILHTRG
jgi:hypothetical protein